MQEGEMRRIHAVVLDLQPVAVPKSRRARRNLVSGQVIGVEHREIRLLVGRTHIREHQSLVLTNRIGAMEKAVLQCAVGRLSRGFEDRAVNVEQPAVIAAADPLFSDQAEFQRGAPMRAVQLQQANRPAAVAKGDEVLAQYTQSPREVIQLAGQNDRLPKTPHIFTAWRARPDAGQLLVFRRPLAVVIGAVGCIEKRHPFGHRSLLHT
jgi:hypothetical protein